MLEVRRMFINKYKGVYDQWTNFLKVNTIKPETNLDFTCGVFDGDELVATGSTYRNIIKCLAVDPEQRGSNTINLLISNLINYISSQGFDSYYLYTKPEYETSFQHLGFKTLVVLDDVIVFMERSVNGIEAYLNEIEKYKKELGFASAIVMNANPFTKGHQYLVEKASKETDIVYVFVVEEDISDFPYDVRLELVKEGCKEFKNVIVVSTGNYIVSSQTFPSYFIQESNDITEVQASLDAQLFKRKIAPVIDIKRRYVGDEPLSIATNIYNYCLKRVLEPEIELVIVPRIESQMQVISASRVRELIAKGDIASLKDLVPKTTYEYLISQSSMEIIESIKTRRN